jgi:hypothetical protein
MTGNEYIAFTILLALADKKTGVHGGSPKYFPFPAGNLPGG